MKAQIVLYIGFFVQVTDRNETNTVGSSWNFMHFRVKNELN